MHWWIVLKCFGFFPFDNFSFIVSIWRVNNFKFNSYFIASGKLHCPVICGTLFFVFMVNLYVVFLPFLKVTCFNCKVLTCLYNLNSCTYYHVIVNGSLNDFLYKETVFRNSSESSLKQEFKILRLCNRFLGCLLWSS